VSDITYLVIFAGYPLRLWATTGGSLDALVYEGARLLTYYSAQFGKGAIKRLRDWDRRTVELATSLGRIDVAHEAKTSSTVLANSDRHAGPPL
jgi:hypothetical protein